MDRSSILIIVGIALAIALVGLAIISLFTYNAPPLPVSGASVQQFTWEDVFMPERISKMRYEIISIYGSDANRTVGIYTINKGADGNFVISIVTYDGVVASSQLAEIKIDPYTYSCISKYYGDKVLGCNDRFDNYDVEVAAHILPNRMRRTEALDVVGVESIAYKGEVYQAIKLQKGGVYVWIAKEIPLPARIEIHDADGVAGATIIANLKSYE